MDADAVVLTALIRTEEETCAGGGVQSETMFASSEALAGLAVTRSPSLSTPAGGQFILPLPFECLSCRGTHRYLIVFIFSS